MYSICKPYLSIFSLYLFYNLLLYGVTHSNDYSDEQTNSLSHRLVHNIVNIVFTVHSLAKEVTCKCIYIPDCIA